ncbi:MAG: ATP-dependent helicase [Lachnospiraceae bacterium]|nr:ATP-dependent helicase [Lachnospiraceae bacterium]
MNYNHEQLLAIRHHEGPCLVVAGPGSGKTAVITARAKNLIETKGERAASLLTLTFSRAAAVEMAARFTEMTASAFPQAVFGTFHSVFFRILREGTEGGEVKILNGAERSRLMEEVMKGLGLYPTKESAAALLRAVSNRKNSGKKTAPEGSLPHAERFEEIFLRYEAMRQELRLTDYDDIAPDCLRLLQRRQDLLRGWQERFAHFQVDEYQDIGPVQEELLHLLAARRGNLFAVGDDDQSIYGFRGADPCVMRRFLTRYPSAEQICLPLNYRSEKEIIEAAEKVIRRNRGRLPKGPMRSALKREGGSAGTFRISECRDTEEELNGICARILEETKEEKEAADFSNTAIIVRTHACAAKAAEILARNRIRFDMKEDVKSLYEENAACDILSYLRFAHDGQKRADFLRIMNKPLRYFSRSCAEHAVVEEAALLRYYRNMPQMQERVRVFFREIKLISAMRPRTAIGYLRRAVGYERFLKAENDRAGVLYALNVLDRMEEDAADHSAGSFFAHVKEALSDAEAARRTNADTGAKGRGVKLMTMHASKGLEFDHVYLPMCNAGVIPHAQAQSEEALEEERRMLYVAMTRARKTLQVSYALASRRGSLLPSPFL